MSAAVASFQGPNRIVVVPVLEAVELFRVVNVERPHHPGLVLDLTSNYERQVRPRRVERFYSILHMAVSTFTTRAARMWRGCGCPAARASASMPRRRVRIARCGVPPVQLAACVVDVVPA